MTVDYLVGDTRKVIAGITDGSVDLIATSPPFLALRSYVPADHESKGDEIGSESNPAEFIDMLLGLTAEWGRVLAPHGSIAIELGDTYSGSGGGGGDYSIGGLRQGQPQFDGSARRGAGRTGGKNGQGTIVARSGKAGYTVDKGAAGWPRAKSLALVPQLYAIALAYGINPLTGQPSPAGRWLVRNVIVWHRPNPAVGALGDKVRPSTSYIVIATRTKDRWFDLTAVRTPVQHPNQTATHRSGKVDASDAQGSTLKLGDYNGASSAGAPPLDAWFDQYDGTHDTWTLTTQPSRLAHYAMWPAKLAERLVLMMCPREVCRVCGEPRRRMENKTPEYAEMRARVGAMNNHADDAERGASNNNRVVQIGKLTASQMETIGWSDCGHDDYRPGHVLDPFAGSGTTLAVADLHHRDATGIDFDVRNHDLYPARYDEVKRALFDTQPEMPGQLSLM